LFNKEIKVPPGHLTCFTDEDDNYIFARPGIHNIADPFLKQVSSPISIHGAENQRNVIEHGNRTIVTVPQGMLGIASDMGQPLLLPPGLHSWKSETIRFDTMCRLNDSPILHVGPFTILTVDDGYVAITINNGKLILLDGGQTHLLTHQKWRFERFMNLKSQSDDVRQITASTADNLMVSIDAVVAWKVSYPQKAAMMITDSMLRSDISVGTETDDDVGSLSKLRREVLKQAISGLAKFVGSINYSDYVLYIRSLLNSKEENDSDNNMGEKFDISNPFFDESGLASAVELANKLSGNFGVEIIGINMIQAYPVNENLSSSLALGAISSAEALHIEAKARGAAKAFKIEAEASAIARKIQADSEADVILIRAKAEAEAEILRSDGTKAAEILRAEGSKEVASLLESSDLAVALEKIKTSAGAIRDSDKFFFGQEPQYLSNLVMKEM
jgi:regulator of protease activity HflC (stomatin/prohibitin superfamily)